VRFGVDVAVVAAVAMAAGPLAVPLWAAIVIRHFHLSGQRR
jgi:hypothetical protein